MEVQETAKGLEKSRPFVFLGPGSSIAIQPLIGVRSLGPAHAEIVRMVVARRADPALADGEVVAPVARARWRG